MFSWRLGFAGFLIVAACANHVTYGNVGVFDGEGQSIQLGETAKIQMVSEEVDIVLCRAGGRVTGSLAWRDRAKYRCKFTLKNLTDKKVTVPVGFPLSSDPPFSEKKINQAEMIARYNFIAGTKNGSYAIRYVPRDVKKQYGHLFTWTMTFKPNETVELLVSYEMKGYAGLASAAKDIYRNQDINDLSSKTYEPPFYLGMLEMGRGEMFGYVTTTGNSWAGKIEKAVFRFRLGEFEEYLRKRGAFERKPTDPHYKKRMGMPAFTTLVRDITPGGWKETGQKRGGKVITWEFTDFKPKRDLEIFYVFTAIPSNVPEYERLTRCIQVRTEQYKQQMGKDLKQLQAASEAEKAKKKNAMKWLERYLKACDEAQKPVGKKDVADVILEFYGIKTNNPRIEPFLTRQIWYPVKTPPAIDPKLKERLLAASQLPAKK